MNDNQVLQAMKKYGGGFVIALARTYESADSDNERRIRREAFPELWEKYSEFAEMDAKKKEAA